MLNQELIDKYKRALDIVNSDGRLSIYTHRVRQTLFNILQEGYWATIDEVVWVECFLNNYRCLEEYSSYKEKGSMSMTIIREFDSNDWNGYAGAENFNDGSNPLISTMNRGEYDVDTIADGESIQLYLYDNCGDCDCIWRMELQDYKTFKIAIIGEINQVLESIDASSHVDEVIEVLRLKLGMSLKKSELDE